MKRMLIAALLALLGSQIASAITPQDDIVKRVGKYAFSADKLTLRGTCVCQDGTGGAGYLFQDERYPVFGELEVVVRCNVPAFDVNTGNFHGTRDCNNFEVLAK
jgi:hypothetical protein